MDVENVDRNSRHLKFWRMPFRAEESFISFDNCLTKSTTMLTHLTFILIPPDRVVDEYENLRSVARVRIGKCWMRMNLNYFLMSHVSRIIFFFPFQIIPCSQPTTTVLYDFHWIKMISCDIWMRSKNEHSKTRWKNENILLHNFIRS